MQIDPRDGGCVLHWVGGYDVSMTPESVGAAGFTKFWFEERFFGRLRANIRAMEEAESTAAV